MKEKTLDLIIRSVARAIEAVVMVVLDEYEPENGCKDTQKRLPGKRALARKDEEE